MVPSGNSIEALAECDDVEKPFLRLVVFEIKRAILARFVAWPSSVILLESALPAREWAISEVHRLRRYHRQAEDMDINLRSGRMPILSSMASIVTRDCW